MRRYRSAAIAIAAMVWIGFGGLTAHTVFADQEAVHGPGPEVEVHLTESFYRALRQEGDATYTTKAADEYLRQIAVSTKFMVETNLRIIRQQARIIELLEKSSPQGTP